MADRFQRVLLGTDECRCVKCNVVLEHYVCDAHSNKPAINAGYCHACGWQNRWFIKRGFAKKNPAKTKVVNNPTTRKAYLETLRADLQKLNEATEDSNE